LNKRIPINRFQVIGDQDSNVLFDQVLPDVRRSLVRAYFTWTAGRSYTFYIHSRKTISSFRATAPESGAGLAGVALFIPFDGADKARSNVAFRATETYHATAAKQAVLSCALVVSHYIPGNGVYSGEIRFPNGIEIVETDHLNIIRDQTGGSLIRFRFEMNVPYENHVLSFPIRSRGETAGQITATVRLQSEDKKTDCERIVFLHTVSPEAYASRILVKQAFLPVIRSGYPDRRQQPDTICYKPPLFRKLAKWFGVSEAQRSFWQPYTYHSLRVENISGEALSLLFNSKILYADRDAVPPFFYPPDMFTGTLKDMSIVVGADMNAGEEALVVMPLFLSTIPKPGEYRRVVTITPMGSQTAIKRIDLPFYVTAPHMKALGFTVAAMLSSIGGFVFLLFRFKRLFFDWKIRWFVIISLFGALTFAVVSLPIRIFSSLLHVVFGPFSVLPIGLFNDLIYYSLLVALLRLIPKPGVVTMVGLVRYLLAGLLTGGFQLTDILFTGNSIVITELAVYASGLSRPGKHFQWNWRGTALLAFFLSLAGMYNNAASIYLNMLLYRLFYADWYIGMTIFFNGFVFTFMGTLLGEHFSKTLAWAEE